MVERSVRDAEVAGSNPVASIALTRSVGAPETAPTQSVEASVYEAWLSLVERRVRDAEVASSNLVASSIVTTRSVVTSCSAANEVRTLMRCNPFLVLSRHEVS